MASGDVLLPSTPTPSTSDISILAAQQQQPQVVQDVQEAFKIPDILYTVVFSILWLFGLARNLASYVVSLGIIPLKTATQLFGIKPTAQTQPHPIRDRKPGSRHTHLSRSEKSSADPSSASLHSRRGWTTHTSGKASSSSTDSTYTYSITGTGSAPGTPRNRHRTSLPTEALTDSENTPDSRPNRSRNRNRNRHTAPPAPSSRLVNSLDPSGSGCMGVSEEEGEMEGDNGGGQRTRNRSRVDHSTRRILFVDLKNNRRQTAPPVPYQPLPLVSGVEGGQGESVQITESPSHDSIGLPILRSGDSQPSRSRPTSAPKAEESFSSSRPITNEFGEFVSATTPVPIPTAPPHTSHSTRFPGECDRDAAAASGTESPSERRPRGKERFRSGFKLFGKKRSSSAASTGETPTSIGHDVARSSASSSKMGSNKLRRKSPYPGRLDSHMRSSSEAVHNQLVPAMASGTGTVSDAEACSTTWVRSRPKKLTRRCRSNSLSEGVQPPPKPMNDPNHIPASTRPSMDIPIPTSSSPSSIPPLLRSSTMASTSTSASSSSTNPIPTNPTTTSTSAPSKRSSTGLSFNPLRDLEARLYYRHGVGTGPNTTDVSSYVTTPVPKTGIKRTNPYVLLGVEPPRGSPSSLSLHLTTSRHTSSPRPASSSGSNSSNVPPSSSTVPGSSTGVVPPVPQRRVSAPAGDEIQGR